MFWLLWTFFKWEGKIDDPNHGNGIDDPNHKDGLNNPNLEPGIDDPKFRAIVFWPMQPLWSNHSKDDNGKLDEALRSRSGHTDDEDRHHKKATSSFLLEFFLSVQK